jgi:hypothetical protein
MTEQRRLAPSYRPTKWEVGKARSNFTGYDRGRILDFPVTAPIQGLLLAPRFSASRCPDPYLATAR